MDIMTAITTAYTGLKYAKETISALITSKIESEVHLRINEVLGKLGEAQDTLFMLRDELFRLQTGNENLRNQIQEQENWKDRLDRYQLVKTSGGAVVYRSKGDPLHYVCPVCLEKKQLQILQDRGVISGPYDCPACKAEYPVDPSQPITLRR